ncbi:MAG: DUF669 domain-containing protein [Planctomycetota bacterium]
MANLNGFNANDVEPAVGFDPIPAGKYLALISDSTMKLTKSGVGNFLELTFQILEGEFKGRLVWARLNLDNTNATTVKIARAELSAICRAVGVLAPKDSTELHNLPLVITVAHKKRQDTGEITNVIKGYAKKDAAATKVTTSGSNGKPPWQK